MAVADEHDSGPEPPADGGPADAPVEPIEPAFWQAYNAELQLPIAGLLSALFHVALVAGLLGLLLLDSAKRVDKTSVPLRLVDGGDDDFGQGMQNVGGVPEPVAEGDSTPTREDFESLPTPGDRPLPEVIKEIQEQIKLDEDLATQPVTPEKAAAFVNLHETLRDKLMPGQRKGAGKGPFTGPAGTGADATKARSLRWVIRFKTLDGRDYLSQLAAFGAVVVVPVPPDNRSAYVFRDLRNPKGELVTEPEWHALAQQVQFNDFRPANVAQVASALGVGDMRPNMFWAFFPKDVEGRLAAMEKGYQNLPPDKVAETVFRVVSRGGQYDLEVALQKTK